MPDTRRVYSELRDLFATNEYQSISPQDVRDGFRSVLGSFPTSASEDASINLTLDNVFVEVSVNSEVFLPEPNANDGVGGNFQGKFYIIRNSGSAGVEVLLKVTSGGLISGRETVYIPSEATVMCISNGTEWVIFGGSTYLLDSEDSFKMRTLGENKIFFQVSPQESFQNKSNVNLGFGAGRKGYESPELSASYNTNAGIMANSLGEGDFNATLGFNALSTNTSADETLVAGSFGGPTSGVSLKSVYLGTYAGQNETDNVQVFIVDTFVRDADKCILESLMYGKFAEDVTDQFLRLNVSELLLKNPSGVTSLAFTNGAKLQETVGGDLNVVLPLNKSFSIGTSAEDYFEVDSEDEVLRVNTSIYLKNQTGNVTPSNSNYGALFARNGIMKYRTTSEEFSVGQPYVETVDMNEADEEILLADRAFYYTVIPKETVLVSKCAVFVSTATGTPTGFRTALYDMDGYSVSGILTSASDNSVGSVEGVLEITLDEPIKLLRNNTYKVAIAGTLGGTSKLLKKSSFENDNINSYAIHSGEFFGDYESLSTSATSERICIRIY